MVASLSQSTGKQSPEWYRTYFSEPYGEVYAEYLLSPDIAAEEAQLACEMLELAPGTRILDCPCGYGRHLEHLSLLFPDIVGLDLDSDCLRRASAQGFLLTRADMRRLPFAAGAFDAILNLFNSFGYFSDTENEALLSEFSRVLAPDGALLLDVANPDPLIELIEEKPRIQQQVGDLLLTEEWRHDDSVGVLHNDTRIELAGRDPILRSYDLRLYTLDDLREMLDRAGFCIVDVRGDFDGEDFDNEESSRMILAAEKINA